MDRSTAVTDIQVYYPRAPVVAAGDYVSTTQQYLWVTPLQNPEINLSHWNRPRGVCDIVLGDFNKLPELHAMFGM